MIMRALICTVLIAGGAVALLNSMAPADTGPESKSVVCILPGHILAASAAGGTFIIEGECE